MLLDLTKQLTQEITERLSTLPKPPLPSFDHGLLRHWVEAAVQKCQLVSREEFDAQTEVLQRTRLKVEALEVQLAQMESKLDVLMGEE
ncbi:MAG: Membrane fusogenic [Pseudomonadota bacterium]|jgi:ubiquinone biosynthesis accessory factor UbiK